MRVILSVDALGPSLSGIGRYTWELASRLGKMPEIDELRYYRNGRWIASPGFLLAEQTDAGGSYLLSEPKWLSKLRLNTQCRNRLFHGPNYFLPRCADYGVATIHDLSVFKFPETHPIERIKHFEREFDYSVKAAACLITDSETTRTELIEYLGCHEKKIRAVPLGVSETFMPRPLNELGIVVKLFGLQPGAYTLCVSTLEPRKRIGNLLLAYRDLPIDLRRNFPLVLAGGTGWLSEKLKLDIEQYAAEGWLKYLGFVPEDVLPILYSGARLFVFPSIYEGFGLPVLESMASGVPVVSSNRSSLPEVSKGAAWLVDPDDVSALKKGIEKGLLDEVWRTNAVSKGINSAEGYSWDRCVSETIKVYETVCADQGNFT